jgi:beta-galactosidase
VSSAFELFANGEFVGYSQDSRLPAEFDVTAAVRAAAGKPLVLAARVFRFCDGSYLEDQDMWWLSGIHRDVILYSKPEELRIADFEFTPSLPTSSSSQAGAARPAELFIRVSLAGSGCTASWPKDATVLATLAGPQVVAPVPGAPHGCVTHARGEATVSTDASD